jgi:simple sugar transport system permease protein
MDQAPAIPSTPSTRTEQRATSSGLFRWAVERRELTVIVVTVLAIVYFSVRASSFYSTANIIVLAQYVAPIMVIGAGEVLMLVLAEIDLSAGQVYLTSPWFVYWFNTLGVPIGLAIVISLALCLLIGLLNGMFTVKFRVPSLIVTLGTLYLFFGYVLVQSNQEQVDMVGTTGTFGKIFGIGGWSTILWALGITSIIWFMLKRTRFGTHITATGGNQLGAAEAGIPVWRVKVWCFLIIALLSGFMGILDGIRVQSMNPGNTGLDIVLTPIVACVIGGTALTGGRATVIGTVIGAIFLGVMEDGLNITGVNAQWFYLFEGIIILGAMAINVQLGQLAAKFRR